MKSVKKCLKCFSIILLAACLVYAGSQVRTWFHNEAESSVASAVEAIALAGEDSEVVLVAETLHFGATSLVSIYDVASINNRTRAMEMTVYSETATETDDGTMVVRNLTLDDITLVEVYVDDGEEKPLLLFLHGIGMDKESVLPYLEDYARAGYYAVSMDAYGQGERSEEGILYDDWACMFITVSDIDQVIELYTMAPNVSTENFVLGGFSMGGIETWVYAEIGSYTPAALLPLCGICETTAWQEDRLDDSYIGWLTELRNGTQLIYEEQIDEYTALKASAIQSLDITSNLDTFLDIPIFMAVGTEDFYFNSDGSLAVFETLQAAGNENAVISIYEGLSHTVTPEMVAESIEFLQEVLA